MITLDLAFAALILLWLPAVAWMVSMRASRDRAVDQLEQERENRRSLGARVIELEAECYMLRTEVVILRGEVDAAEERAILS